MDTQLTDEPIQLEPCEDRTQKLLEDARPHDPRFSKVTLQDYMAENKGHAAYSSPYTLSKESQQNGNLWRFARKERISV